MRKILLISLLLLCFSPSFIYSADGVVDEKDIETTVEVENSSEKEELQINSNTKKVTNIYFDLTLERKPQSAFGKHVPYVLTIKPHIDSPKTQIMWNVPSTLSATGKHSEFVSLREGETYTFKGSVKPLRDGIYDFSVSVISWQHNTNYTNSIDDTLVFNKSLVLQPVSSEYTIANIIKIFLILVIFGVICFLVIHSAKKYSKKAKTWLTPPY